MENNPTFCRILRGDKSDTVVSVVFTTKEIVPTDVYKAERIRTYFANITPQQKVAIYTDILCMPSRQNCRWC